MNNCPICKTNQYVKIEATYANYVVYCENCYDVDCDADGYFTKSLQAFGRSEKEAALDWDVLVGEAND